MKKHYNISIVGATGAVGFRSAPGYGCKKLPVHSLSLLASKRSKGKKITFRDEEFEVEELTHDSFKGADIAFFCAGASRSREFVSSAVKAGQ